MTYKTKRPVYDDIHTDYTQACEQFRAVEEFDKHIDFERDCNLRDIVQYRKDGWRSRVHKLIKCYVCGKNHHAEIMAMIEKGMGSRPIVRRLKWLHPECASYRQFPDECAIRRYRKHQYAKDKAIEGGFLELYFKRRDLIFLYRSLESWTAEKIRERFPDKKPRACDVSPYYMTMNLLKNKYEGAIARHDKALQTQLMLMSGRHFYWAKEGVWPFKVPEVPSDEYWYMPFS